MASYDEWRLVETEFIDGPCSGLLTMTFGIFSCSTLHWNWVDRWSRSIPNSASVQTHQAPPQQQLSAVASGQNHLVAPTAASISPSISSHPPGKI